jgi:hypothetical protein
VRRFALDKTAVVAIIVGVVLVAVYAATVALSNRYYLVAAPRSSVYSASPEGFKVFYTYLAELGREPKVLQSYEQLPEGATIIVAAPFEKPPSQAEGKQLGAWVKAGGRVVAVGGDARSLLEPMGFGGSPNAGEASETLSPLFPGAYATGVSTVRPGPDRLLVDESAWVAQLKDFAGQVLVSRKVGKGEVVWLAGPWLMSNEGIGTADNGQLALDIATAGGRPVYFDEFHHGFVREAGYWSRLGPQGRAAVLLLAGALVLAIVGWARRMGPPIPEVELPAARGGAYIGQLAQLYRKAGARAEALASLEDGLARALVRRHGTLDAGLAHHADAREALETSRGLRERGGMAEDTFVATARRLAVARQEVEA